jgi:microcystin-dependent protein
MSQPYVGQMTIFAGNFAINGWAMCTGQLTAISQNAALFTLIGTTYGGDGQNTFALPDMRGRVGIGQGTQSGLSTYVLGQTGGQEQVQLTAAQLPQHSHTLNATSTTASSQNISASALPGNTANVTPEATNFYVSNVGSPAPTFLTLANATIGQAGGNVAHDNMMPYLTMTYLISLFGIFPSRN